jgi:VWFA-related protein
MRHRLPFRACGSLRFRLLVLLLFLIIVPAYGQAKPPATPQIRLVHPENGAYLSGRTLLEAELSAAPADPFTQMQFLVNGKIIAQLKGPPWQAWYDFGEQIEAHFIQARGTTAAGTMVQAEATTRRLVIHQATGIDLVNVFATVQDRGGRFVMNLKREDFMLMEDGRPQTVSYFSRDRLPLAIEIIIDTSLSMEGRNLVEAREAAVGFLNALESVDLAGVMAFSDEARQLHDLSTDRPAAATAIQMTRAGGGTALYDAVAEACRRLAEVEDERRRAIILLSDGRDEAASGLTPGSLLTFEETLAEVVQSNVILYAIGLGRDLTSDLDFYHRRSLAEVLETLAVESGGRAFFTPKAERLRKAYAQVENELRHHYTLSYTSTNRRKDGVWRAIDLRVRRSGFTVTSRRGYYAPWSGPPS